MMILGALGIAAFQMISLSHLWVLGMSDDIIFLYPFGTIKCSATLDIRLDFLLDPHEPMC